MFRVIFLSFRLVVPMVFIPATFDEPCPFMEKFQELKNSEDPDDKALASKLVPRRRYILGVIGYKDTKGKEIDPDKIDKPMMVPRSVYQDIIDLYLDEEDWGDMTDPIEGYDIKITRTGSGKMDTSYSVSPCQKSKLDKKYREDIDLEKAVRASILSYDKLEEKLAAFLNESDEDSDIDEMMTAKKSKLVDKRKRRKVTRVIFKDSLDIYLNRGWGIVYIPLFSYNI